MDYILHITIKREKERERVRKRDRERELRTFLGNITDTYKIIVLCSVSSVYIMKHRQVIIIG